MEVFDCNRIIGYYSKAASIHVMFVVLIYVLANVIGFILRPFNALSFEIVLRMFNSPLQWRRRVLEG
jgi:hypothetical protein